jgi:hypothetical protein
LPQGSNLLALYNLTPKVSVSILPNFTPILAIFRIRLFFLLVNIFMKFASYPVLILDFLRCPIEIAYEFEIVDELYAVGRPVDELYAVGRLVGEFNAVGRLCRLVDRQAVGCRRT